MAELQQVISDVATSLLDGKRHIRLLEAGCGSIARINLKADVHAVGIDISREHLEKNPLVQEKIVGDIQSYPLPRDDFDVAVCWMVLEHLDKPNEALRNLFGAVKPGGLLILGFPNILSFKGIVTKVTPFWFHKFFYRFMGYKSHPFPTYHRLAILPKRVRRTAAVNGFSVAFWVLEQGGMTQRVMRRFWIMNVTFRWLDSVVQLLCRDRSQSLLLDNCACIFKKTGS